MKINLTKSNLYFFSIIYVLINFFLPEMTKAGMDDLFKRQQSSNCNFQNSNFIGVSIYGSVLDERFCFDGNRYIEYSNLFPNGNFGGTLNKPFRGANYADRNKKFEYKLEDDYLWLYQCSADYSLECVGPVTRRLRAAIDYKAYAYNGEILMWDKDDKEGGINLMIESINLNPQKTKSQKLFQANTYSQAAFALMDIKKFERAIDFSKRALKLTNLRRDFTYNWQIQALSQYGLDNDNDKYCSNLSNAVNASNFERSKGWFIDRESYENSCS